MLQIFSKDFGIRPFNAVSKLYKYCKYPGLSDSLKLYCTEITAYLTVPVVKAPLDAEPGPELVTYTVQHEVDPGRLARGISKGTQHRFKKAIKALRLEVPHEEITVGYYSNRGKDV